MILLTFAAVAGGALTLAALWSYGIALAILSAPVGGSLAATCAALFIALCRSGRSGAAGLWSGLATVLGGLARRPAGASDAAFGLRAIKARHTAE